MATLRTAAVSAVFALLMIIASAAPVVWAQTADPATLAVLERLAGAVERLTPQQAQSAPATPPAPAISTPVPAGGCAPENCPTREEFEQLKKKVSGVEGRVTVVERTLKGRIAPHQPSATPAPPATKGSQPAIAAPAVSMAAPAAERLLAVKFLGAEPNPADVAKVGDLLRGGRYGLEDVVLLPTAGATPRERGHLSQARVNALRQDMQNPSLSVRDPADSEEAAQLVAGAPAGTGAVFHLRLAKKAQVAATP